MKSIQKGTVIATVEDVYEFKRKWPASGLGMGPYWFQFDEGGNLVDTNVPTSADGYASLALSEDAQAFLQKNESKTEPVREIQPTQSSSVRRHKLAPGECTECDRYSGTDFHPSHDASPRCESGKRTHCTCDTCF